MWKNLLIGRVVSEPEIKTITGRTGPVNVATFDLAVNTISGETSFINGITAWGAQADLVASTFRKGLKIYAETEAKNRKYEKDGVTRVFQDHRLITFEYLEPRRDDAKEEETQEAPAEVTAPPF
jgi:single-stranded DNA-binding protein